MHHLQQGQPTYLSSATAIDPNHKDPEMFSLNPQATPFTPSTFSIVKVPIYNDGKISAVRVLNSDDFSREFLHDFDVSMVPDEDL